MYSFLPSHLRVECLTFSCYFVLHCDTHCLAWTWHHNMLASILLQDSSAGIAMISSSEKACQFIMIDNTLASPTRSTTTKNSAVYHVNLNGELGGLEWNATCLRICSCLWSDKQGPWMSLVIAILVYSCTYVTLEFPFSGKQQQTYKPKSTDSHKRPTDFAMRGRTSEDASAMQRDIAASVVQQIIVLKPHSASATSARNNSPDTFIEGTSSHVFGHIFPPALQLLVHPSITSFL